MAKKEKVKPDFRLNPDNIKVNDWVFSGGDIGFVEGVAIDTENMLKFFVLWNNEPPVVPVLAENLKKLNRPVAVGELNYTIDLDLLVLSPELQQRVKLDKSVVEEYAEAFKNHVKFPPITIWYRTDVEYTGTPLLHPAYLIDGFHRVEAAQIAGITELPFIRKQGTYREALLYSTSINSTHGLRRSNADKRKSVITLLQDPEWSGWSDRKIARHCGVSHDFVNRLRKSLSLNDSEKNDTKNNDTKNNDTQTRTYITKHGTKAKMNTTNIGKSKVEEPETNLYEDNPDPDSEFNDGGFLPEDNYPEDNHYYPEDVIKDLWDDDDDSVSEYSVKEDSVSYHEDNEDNNELQDNEDNNEDKPVYPNPSKPSKRRKRTQKKQRLVNPLSVGDRVKVKDNHYFGGKIGEVTQIANHHSVMVAFEDNHCEFLQLSDLDLPESLQKPLLEKPQRPQKKEIVIKEGLNYFIRESEDKCRWYVELDEEIYEGLKIYQERVQAMSVNAAIIRFLEKEGILLRPFPENKIIDEKPSAITSLTNDTRNKLEDFISKHGESGIMKLLDEE